MAQAKTPPPPQGKALMFQGTGSDVGKSLIVAGLCRAFKMRGLRVLPFKPQNMSNNAAVTADGGEIGRAQALQARACGVPLSVDMNPVLLKPQTEIGSQVVIQGKVWGNAKAREYQGLKPQLMAPVLESFERLRSQCDLLLIEGAGSAAEINLRAGDIANMGFACATDTPVCLIGDIDRGGVIAQIVGTHALLPPEERALLAGYVINKFRGDVSLFDSGLEVIKSHSGLRSFGVIPYFWDAKKLPPEDAMGVSGNHNQGAALKIAIPQLPRIANFDDFDPLAAEPDVNLVFVPKGEALPGDADLVILPGSKATLSDLAALRAEGWDVDLQAHLRRGGWVLGVCGGYQMLGQTIADPDGIEGAPGSAPGLGLLAIETIMGGDKTLTEARGTHPASSSAVDGYEIHIGKTDGPDCVRPLFELTGKPEGATSTDGRVMGAYLHGLFSNDSFRHHFLNAIRTRTVSGVAYEAQVETTLDALAAHLEACLDLDQLYEAAR